MIDARLLWQDERWEGGFLMALVAVAARARQEHPRPMTERDAFERFVRSRFQMRWSVEYRDDQWDLESVFYKWMRCELVHEGGLPVDLRFMEDVEADALAVRAGGAPSHVLLVSPGWFHQLLAWAES